jgi:hypothetical protein
MNRSSIESSLSRATDRVADAAAVQDTVAHMSAWHLLIDRDDLRRTSVVEVAPAELDGGRARLRVDAFGLTANNVTYGAAGDMLGYWSFFPAPDSADDVNWGRVPVWGFAEVVESRCDGVEAGERLYGYLPMSTELVIEPGRLAPASLVDASPHRAALPQVYNQFTRCAADPLYDPDREDMAMLFRPLFFTSFMIDDLLDDHQLYGATTVVLTSASSKTSFGTAHLLQQRDGIEVVGLTSAANVGFVEGLGCYDRVVTYDRVGSLPVAPAVLLDFAGNADVVRSVHEHYGDALQSSQIIGLTHWEDRAGSADPLTGPAQELFFAPTQIDKRRGEWGPGVLEQRLGEAWAAFVPQAAEWVTVEHGTGADAVAEVWAELVEGSTRPDRAHVLHPGS